MPAPAADNLYFSKPLTSAAISLLLYCSNLLNLLGLYASATPRSFNLPIDPVNHSVGSEDPGAALL